MQKLRIRIDNHMTLRERIVESIRNAIVNGTIPAGSRVAEPDLAERFGISRTPVREALRQLGAEASQRGRGLREMLREHRHDVAVELGARAPPELLERDLGQVLRASAAKRAAFMEMADSALSTWECAVRRRVLDLETLELLEDLLVEFGGTVLLVSHDRAFLDNVVSGTLAFEGNGVVNEYVGGYSDFQNTL